MTDRQTDGRTRPFIVKDTEIWTRNIRNYLQVMLSDPHTKYAFLGCVDYGMLQKIGGSVVCSPGRTKLDRERTSLCLAEIVKI